MSDLIGELVASQSAEELDAVVEKISMEKIVALADEEASSLKTQLTSLLESPLVDNSKRRRRITRLVSNLEDRSKAEEKIKAQQETAAPTAWAHAMSATTRLREEVSGIYDKHVLVKRWGLLYFVAFYTPYLIPRRLLHLIGPTTPISGYAECSHLLPPSPVFFSLPYIT